MTRNENTYIQITFYYYFLKIGTYEQVILSQLIIYDLVVGLLLRDCDY